MLSSSSAPTMLAPPAIRLGGQAGRIALAACTLALVAASFGIVAASAPSDVDPDLMRVMRFMALIKGGLALAALLASHWRLARPAAPWRNAVYILGPGLVASGAVGLWAMQAPALAALVLHAALFGLLAAALTDRAFVATVRTR